MMIFFSLCSTFSSIASKLSYKFQSISDVFLLGSILPAFPLFFNKTTFLVDCTRIDSLLSHQRDDNDEGECWSCYKFCNETDRVLIQLLGLRSYIENGRARGTRIIMIFLLFGLWAKRRT